MGVYIYILNTIRVCVELKGWSEASRDTARLL